MRAGDPISIFHAALRRLTTAFGPPLGSLGRLGYRSAGSRISAWKMLVDPRPCSFRSLPAPTPKPLISPAVCLVEKSDLSRTATRFDLIPLLRRPTLRPIVGGPAEHLGAARKCVGALAMVPLDERMARSSEASTDPVRGRAEVSALPPWSD